MLPLIAAAAPIAASAISAFGAHSANKRSQAMAREQMAFQERMSSTAHQREVVDLRAAGLNPILSGIGGKGASSPPGAMGQVSNVGEAATSAFSRQQSSQAQAEQATAEADKQKMYNRIIEDVIPLIRDGIGVIKSGTKAAGEKLSEIVQRVEDMLANAPKMPSMNALGGMIRDAVAEATSQAARNVSSAVGATAVVDGLTEFKAKVEGAIDRGVRRAQTGPKDNPELYSSGRSRGVNPRNAHQRNITIMGNQ